MKDDVVVRLTDEQSDALRIALDHYVDDSRMQCLRSLIRPAEADNEWAWETCEDWPPEDVPLSEGALMCVYMQMHFDRCANKNWTTAEYLLRFALAVQLAVVEGFDVAKRTGGAA